MLRRFLLIAVLAVGALFAPLEQLRVTSVAAAKSERQECVVYVTRTGARYHMGGCRYLRRSRIPMTKPDAQKAGYTPCRVCGGSNC
jgi:hypothetical protein